MPSTLLVTPQVEEADALLGTFHLHGIARAEARAGRLSCTMLRALDMLLAIGGNGKAQFAVQCQHLIDHCSGVKLLICAGAAGSLDPAVRVGDVVVSTTTVEHDVRERFVPVPPPRHAIDAGALDDLRRTVTAQPLPFAVHFGPIASGDEDIVDRTRAAELRDATGALCVAWEGSGGARAARFSDIGFMEIRAITDSADAGAAASFRASLQRVVAHAAQLLLAWHAERSGIRAP